MLKFKLNIKFSHLDVWKILQATKHCLLSLIAVCKPSVAHGSDAHQMAIVFNEEGVADCRPPCVAQSFINHNAVLYKIYTVGDDFNVSERPSLKNFAPSGTAFLLIVSPVIL